MNKFLMPVTDEMRMIFKDHYNGTAESVEVILTSLKEKVYSKAQAVRLLKAELNLSLVDADRIVMNAAAWSEGKEGKEMFREAFIDAITSGKTLDDVEEMELCQKHSDIFSNLSDFALVGKPDSLVILKISTMGLLLIEEDYEEIKNLMKKKGVKIVRYAEEVRPKDFEQFHNVWDEEQKIIRRVSQSELNQILEERAKKKGKK